MRIHIILWFVLFLLLFSCGKRVLTVSPDIISESTMNDTDDPAIWVHPQDASKSIVFGTDKETNGAIYAFDLNGRVMEEKTIRELKRPNNIDVEYGFRLNDSISTDILAFTERERNQIRVFSVPEMKPLDSGGFSVFEDEANIEERLPMGICLYKSPKTQIIYAIVGRKSGPSEGYLYQYQLEPNKSGKIEATLVRKFGKFSGTKEIEAIAIDDAKGFVYYSDEGVCIRKYHAEPSLGDDEIACFGGEYFKKDIEGIAISYHPGEKGYLIVSDQQKGRFNVFSREDNSFLKAIDLGTKETDGCEVVSVPLNATFKTGLFVAMNDEKNFYFYDLEKLGLAP